MKKQKKHSPGIVYSTDPNFNISSEQETVVTLPPGQQFLRVTLETKHRAGKTVTLVVGFIGNEADLGELGKKLKNHCGTGGSSKDGEIILQGDQREKLSCGCKKIATRLNKKTGHGACFANNILKVNTTNLAWLHQT